MAPSPHPFPPPCPGPALPSCRAQQRMLWEQLRLLSGLKPDPIPWSSQHDAMAACRGLGFSPCLPGVGSDQRLQSTTCRALPSSCLNSSKRVQSHLLHLWGNSLN